MELDKLKETWDTQRVPSEFRVLQPDDLRQMIKRRYHFSMLRLLTPLIVQSGFYLFLLASLVVFFSFFNTWMLKGLVVLAMFLLVVLPVLSLGSLYVYFNAWRVSDPIRNNLIRMEGKDRFLQSVQFLKMALNMVLWADLIILLPLIYSEQLTVSQTAFSVVVSVLIIGIFSIRIWISHRRLIRKIEEHRASLL